MRSNTRLLLCALAVLVVAACGSDTKHADVRVLNVSVGYQSLDMYTNKNGTSGDSELLDAVAYDAITSYSSVDSGTYEVKFRVHGNSGNLEDLTSESFTDGTHATYVAYGSTGNFATVRINEDVGDQDSGKSSVGVYNVAEAGALDVYLTDSTTSLSDVSPTFSSVSAGGSGSVTIDKGTYRLRVTGAGNSSDLRLDVASITFNDKQNSSVILTSTTGGVLVNAMYLPQQGSLTQYLNTNARVRAAVGISDGTLANVTVGGTALLSNATSGVISGSYTQFSAGSTAVDLTVDGNAVSVANQTLVAGADYTLLVWSNADGTQTTLISDDNHIPTTSGKLKMRILNGMSALGDEVNFTANFSPVASGIAVGLASTPEEISSGSDYELDVTDATNGASLLSKTSVSLVAGDVYTLFVVGGGTATVVGSLHEDAGT
jgi:Domain of unknown function (DUF4397)